jgi:hypothetical protein
MRRCVQRRSAASSAHANASVDRNDRVLDRIDEPAMIGSASM